MEDLESRVEELEKQKCATDSAHLRTYASAVSTPPVSSGNQSDRLEKLEFNASEEERKGRSLCVQITHPTLDPTSSELTS